MKNYFYPQSIHTSRAAFCDLFNNMTVRVYDKTGNIVGVKPVPFYIAPKEKLASLLLKTETNDVDPQVDNYLPKISCNTTGITWDSDRMRGKDETRLLNVEYYDHETLMPDGTYAIRTMQVDCQPIPYKLDFEVILWTKYDTDMLQLQENILPEFAPESYISIKERNFGIERKRKVTLNNVTLNNIYELGESDRRVLMSSLGFTMETEIYKPMRQMKDIRCTIISIVEVPCKRQPMQGSKIMLTDSDDTANFCLDERTINASIHGLRENESYDKMVNYWRFANNVMSTPYYTKCISNNCQEPVPPAPIWDPSAGYTECHDPERKPYVFDNQTTGYIEIYFQKIITGKFLIHDEMIEGFVETSLPPLNPDNTRTFGKDNIINTWYFKRLVTQTGETVKDSSNRDMILLIDKTLYPEVSTQKPQDIPQNLSHLGD